MQYKLTMVLIGLLIHMMCYVQTSIAPMAFGLMAYLLYALICLFFNNNRVHFVSLVFLAIIEFSIFINN